MNTAMTKLLTSPLGISLEHTKNVATTIIYYLYIEMYQTDSIKIMVHVMHREKYKIAHGINIDV